MTRREDGRWVQAMTFTRRDGAKIRKYFYGKTKSEVLRKIADYEEELEHGLTFGEVADMWWEETENTLAFTTAKSYKPAFKRAVDAFGKVHIKSIESVMISRFLTNYAKETKASAKTAKNQLIIFSLIFKYAVNNGYTSTNPARDVTLPKGLRKTPRDIASPEDIRRVKESVDLPYGLLAYMALYTGLRRGELIALTWEDIDLKNRTITVNKAAYIKNNQPVLKPPKTDAGVRVVPILDKLAEKLKPSKGLVFTSPDGKMLTEGWINGIWHRYCEASGVTCTLHQLRHAYATMLFEAGIDVKDAQALLGHAQASTTQEIYTHIREQRQAKIRNQLLSIDIS